MSAYTPKADGRIMAKRSAAKSIIKTVLKYKDKAKYGYRRLPFVGKSASWDVPATGGYQGGCEFGVWAAVAFLKMLRAQKDAGPGFLQSIVLAMLNGSNSAELGDGDGSFRGQVVGFFSTLDHALHTAAMIDPQLDEYSERDLAAAMTRAVNFDEEAWNAAMQTLWDQSDELSYIPFHAYTRTKTSAAAKAA